MNGIIYLLTGCAHAARLAVSLWSLRKHYKGPVIVYTTHTESHYIGEKLANDNRLGIIHIECEAVKTRKNSSFLTKIKLLEKSPFDLVTYLDADTLITGDISALTESQYPFTATNFAGWSSHHGLVRKRIERWRTLEQSQNTPGSYASMIDEAVKPHPAVNGGVLSCRPKISPLLWNWFEFAMIGARTFICDEIALQILTPLYPHGILDCRYNCSPKYAPQAMLDDARIIHFHGEKHLREEKARQIWVPAYEETLVENVGDIKSWTPGGDPELAAYLAKKATT